MSPLYAVIGGLVLVALARRWRRGARSPRLATFARTGWERRFGTTGLVAGREVHERLRGPLFRIITLVLLAVVAAAILIPALQKGHAAARETVAILGRPASFVRPVVRAEAEGNDLHLRLVAEPDRAAALKALRAGRVDLVVDDERALVVASSLPSSGTSASAQFVRSLASALGLERAFRSAGLSAVQAYSVTHAKALSIRTLAPSAKTPATSPTSVIGLVLIFIMLTQYNTWTLMGVMEEKSSRVVEVLLAAVRPVQLLGGKVLGIGLLAMLQAGLLVAFALILADAVGSSLLHGTAPLVVVATLVWLVLGYAFYCWVYAAAGSMAERQDQVQSLVLPLSIPIIAGYVISLTALSSGHAALWFKVLAFLPPTAPLAMPVLVGLKEVAWWGFAASVVISLVSTFWVARLAAAVYARAVLRTGRRVRLRDLRSS